ncbi:Hypothetical protein, putative [Bodo saltans]|uniref:Phosphatidylethanolamine-binding protein n=1 Tax=Bodo saltans TaxID=75058 RepID=A0A0S4JIJ2_BODSA|nr:Hypothetical protein, putative [Bodo saltans]|eukprot:CUG88818.1 Hypothetical protein, putative [Bodo saltans]
MLRAQHSASTAAILRQRSIVVSSETTCVGLLSSRRSVHMPGWKSKQSTKDVRTREQREVDRKARQIEKLPRPEALHDFQYPYEKTVLADHMFQPPVFESTLDTPHLYHPTVPSDFFLYWNCADFDRTDYPEVPKHDHRLLIPTRADELIVDDVQSSSSPSLLSKKQWIDHRALLAKYLAKHQVSPTYFPYVSQEANLSVTFAGTYGGWRSRRDVETGAPLPPPAPVTALSKRNFWFTSQAGNYIELCELQEEPSIFFTTPAGDDSLYTLVIASPDYPYRTSPLINDQSGQGGFFLHYMVANLKGGQDLSRKIGEVVVPYVPPLPTEDGGSTRHMCILFKQNRQVPNIKPLVGKAAEESFTFQDRCHFVLHGDHRSGAHGSIASLKDVERSLPADPVAVTMFQTTWDIQVQEFYEKIGQPEPAFQLDSELEAILRFNSLKPEDLAVHARHQPDGSTNMGTNHLGQQMTHQLVQWESTNPAIGRMKNLWSRRTQLGSNNRPITTWN